MTCTVEKKADSLDKKIYSLEQLTSLNPERIPTHVAIVMDGNRRWAKKHFLPAIVGHWKGIETLIKTVRAASEMGIKVLTVFAFSTENWNRSKGEVEALMHLLKIYLLRQRDSMIQEGVRLNAIGNLQQLPMSVQKTLQETKEATKEGQKIQLVLALNYGGRDDICRAVQTIVSDCIEQKISKDEISEELISKHLDTALWPDPDLLIRTSGEQRVSNFLLWQISYSEIFMTSVFWPDFNEHYFLQAVIEYQNRERRLGA